MALALDASIVIGFLDRSDALHDAAREAVVGHLRDRRGAVAVSAVTMAEVLTGALRSGHGEIATRRFFDDLVSEVIAIDAGVAELAARMRAESSLRMPDALTLACAASHPGVEALLTADRRLARAEAADLELRLLAA